MPSLALSTALKQEHCELDSAIEGFIGKLEYGSVQPEALTAALEALRRHIYLEEVFLFPPIREAGMVMPIFVMMREHGELWRSMDALTALVEAGAEPARLEEACQELLGQLERHNGKEEPIIYPLADTGLTPEAAAELERFIGQGATPSGWTCRQAGGDGS